MPRPKIDINKTREEQIWDDIAKRVMWFTARQVSKKLMTSVGYVRDICEGYHKRNILDKKIVNKTNYYRIKP